MESLNTNTNMTNKKPKTQFSNNNYISLQQKNSDELLFNKEYREFQQFQTFKKMMFNKKLENAQYNDKDLSDDDVVMKSELSDDNCYELLNTKELDNMNKKFNETFSEGIFKKERETNKNNSDIKTIFTKDNQNKDKIVINSNNSKSPLSNANKKDKIYYSPKTDEKLKEISKLAKNKHIYI